MGRDAGDDVTHAKISRPAVTTESLAVLSSVAEESTRLSVFNQNQYKRLLFWSRVDPLKTLQKLGPRFEYSQKMKLGLSRCTDLNCSDTKIWESVKQS